MPPRGIQSAIGPSGFGIVSGPGERYTSSMRAFLLAVGCLAAFVGTAGPAAAGGFFISIGGGNPCFRPQPIVCSPVTYRPIVCAPVYRPTPICYTPGIYGGSIAGYSFIGPTVLNYTSGLTAVTFTSGPIIPVVANPNRLRPVFTTTSSAINAATVAPRPGVILPANGTPRVRSTGTTFRWSR